MIPSSSQNPEDVPPGWCCAYVGYFEKCGLTFPIPSRLLEILQHLRLAFPQMCPNFVRHTLALNTRAWEENLLFNHETLLQLCRVKSNARSGRGTFYMSAHPGRVVLEGLASCKDSGWRESYFFFKVDRHSIGDFDFTKIATKWAERLG